MCISYIYSITSPKELVVLGVRNSGVVLYIYPSRGIKYGVPGISRDDFTFWGHDFCPTISETELYLIQERVFSEMVVSSMIALGAGIGTIHHLKVDVPQHEYFRLVFGLLRKFSSWLQISLNFLGRKI